MMVFEQMLAGVPGAAQHKRSAVMRCRTGTFAISAQRNGELSVCEGPASAVHRFALHRVRDTGPPNAIARGSSPGMTFQVHGTGRT
jgi:hypothetical protein